MAKIISAGILKRIFYFDSVDHDQKDNVIIEINISQLDNF